MLFIGKAVCDLKQQSNQVEPEATLQNRRVKELAQRGSKLRAFAAVLLTLASCVPQSGLAQQSGAGSNGPDKAASELPPAPMPNVTQQNLLHPSDRDFTKPFGSWLRNPINVYTPTTIDKASFVNSVRLNDLVKDGKIYLSLSDASLSPSRTTTTSPSRATTSTSRTLTFSAPGRARLRSVCRRPWSPTRLLVPLPLSNRWRTRRHDGRLRRRGFRAVRLDADDAGAGPVPENFDPSVTGTIQFERARQPQVNTLFSGGLKAAHYEY